LLFFRSGAERTPAPGGQQIHPQLLHGYIRKQQHLPVSSVILARPKLVSSGRRYPTTPGHLHESMETTNNCTAVRHQAEVPFDAFLVLYNLIR
jgi:hypothetical protein